MNIEKIQAPEKYEVSLKILLKKSDEYLLLNISKKDKISTSKHFDLPGGRININETFIPFHELIDREIKEEIGTNVKYKLRSDPVSIGESYIPERIEIKSGEIRGRFFVLFEAEYLGGEIKTSDEHSGYTWLNLSKDKVENLFTPLLWDLLKNYFDWNK